MSYFRGILINNLFLKVISLFFAVTIWFYITPIISKDTIEINYAIPLQLKNIPENIMISGKVDDHISVRFKGRQNAIKELDMGQVNVSIDLSNGREGGRVYTLDRSNINIPSNIDVVRIDPKIIKIDMVRVIKKNLKVKVEIAGMPAKGYRVKRVFVRPSEVAVEGPESELGSLYLLEGLSLDVTGRRSSFSKEVKINIPQRNVRIIGNDIILIDVEVEKT
ncbi:MAG: CdaR family protein [Nitrospira sp.]|nr:CdaR family protein [Nitrospira sp.]